jgi:hypothetical protein
MFLLFVSLYNLNTLIGKIDKNYKIKSLVKKEFLSVQSIELKQYVL